MKTNILLEGANGTELNGEWFSTEAGGEYIAVSGDLSVGTGTIVIEGRVAPGEVAVKLVEWTATDGALVARFPQMRARLTAGAAATVRVVAGETLRR